MPQQRNPSPYMPPLPVEKKSWFTSVRVSRDSSQHVCFAVHAWDGEILTPLLNIQYRLPGSIIDGAHPRSSVVVPTQECNYCLATVAPLLLPHLLAGSGL